MRSTSHTEEYMANKFALKNGHSPHEFEIPQSGIMEVSLKNINKRSGNKYVQRVTQKKTGIIIRGKY